MKGSSATMKGLLAGELDVALAGGDAAIKAAEAGGDLVILAGLVNKHYHQLIGRGDEGAGGPRIALEVVSEQYSERLDKKIFPFIRHFLLTEAS